MAQMRTGRKKRDLPAPLPGSLSAFSAAPATFRVYSPRSTSQSSTTPPRESTPQSDHATDPQYLTWSRTPATVSSTSWPTTRSEFEGLRAQDRMPPPAHYSRNNSTPARSQDSQLPPDPRLRQVSDWTTPPSATTRPSLPWQSESVMLSSPYQQGQPATDRPSARLPSALADITARARSSSQPVSLYSQPSFLKVHSSSKSREVAPAPPLNLRSPWSPGVQWPAISNDILRRYLKNESTNDSLHLPIYDVHETYDDEAPRPVLLDLPMPLPLNRNAPASPATTDTSSTPSSYIVKAPLSHSSSYPHSTNNLNVPSRATSSDPSTAQRNVAPEPQRQPPNQHVRPPQFVHYRAVAGPPPRHNVKEIIVGRRINKPFTCRFCTRRYAEETQRAEHETKHKHPCDECDAVLTSNEVLRTHKERHRGVRAHACPICGKGFMTSGDLYQHMRQTHGCVPDKLASPTATTFS
ncbi:hypothetical protein EXIGLDRAFT_748914 [Exidia glandulosa HHB12029]|uniref:C2H2-type domain-containing protein n=1 Tax=Exidia glandulosa HHB12029 TaxID=1314781 RepID=A0A165ITX7_EXIGL|nr:hypothetical protein EXIGLDRAFT_748914 [Exidia glandulosa HHB12029]